LFGAIWLIEPDSSDRVGFVVNGAFGNVEVFAVGVVDFQIGDFASHDDTTWVDVADGSARLVVFVSAGEIIE